MNGKKITLLLATFLLPLSAGQAQDPFATHVRPTDPLTPEAQLEAFHVPEGFAVQLVAAEPEIQKPMNLAFDARGRLWVTSSVEYPYAAEEGKGRDRVSILEDTDDDGRADRVTVFADGLNIPIGLYPYRDGVVVYSIPNIWFLRDTDGDGRCDKREILYGPLGDPVDTHGMQNAFRRGFDGWLYICHGFKNESTIRGRDGSAITMQSGNTYRVRLDGSRVEQFTWGQVNPFGSTLTPEGDFITADCHSKPLTLLLRGGYSTSFGKPHDGLGFVPSIMDHSHGSTAIAGAAYYDGDGFPEPWRNSLFVGNVMTSRVNRDSLIRRGSTIVAREEEDFVSCDDPWFRPVDLRIGPDGALYIADFYNRIIGHYEVDLDHPGRDRTSGRIWRVVHSATNPRNRTAPRNLAVASVPELITALDDSSLAVRSLATDELTDRAGVASLKSLQTALATTKTDHGLVHALWALHRLDGLDEPALVNAASDSRAIVRMHVMRILAERPTWTDATKVMALTGLTDSDPMVRRTAADALKRHRDAEFVVPLLQARRNAAPEDVHLQHNLMIALREQLREAGSLEKLSDVSLSDDERRMLCRVLLAVAGEEAAEYLLAAIQESIIERDQISDVLRNVASYISEERIDSFVALARRHTEDDIDFQAGLIQQLQTQMVQRGYPSNSELAKWGRHVVRELLRLAHDESPGWTNLTLDNPWSLEQHTTSAGKSDVVFLSSHSGERQAGILRSDNFAIPKSLSFELAGYCDFPRRQEFERSLVRLVLADSREIVMRELPPRSDQAQRIDWDLSDVAGRTGYLELVDGLEQKQNGWLAAAAFDPPIAALPNVSPAEAARRNIAAAATASALQLTEFNEELARIASAAPIDLSARAACVDALLTFDPWPVAQATVPVLRDPSVSRSLQQSVASAIIARDEGVMPELLNALMRSVPTRLQEAVAESLCRSNQGAEQLLRIVAEGLVPPALLQRPSITRALSARDRPDISEQAAKLTRDIVPLSEQLAALISERRASLEAESGHAEAGRDVFGKHCQICHQTGGQGALIGPQLDGIASRGMERILEDVLDPNRNIDAAFHVSTMATADGLSHSGLFRRQEGLTRIYAGRDGKEFSIPVSEIEDEVKSPTSIMPDNVATLLSEAEFRDLISYLLSLRASSAIAAGQ